jgi:DNA polymerase-3 subunit gamma/tau
MVLVRLAYVADLPAPADLVRALTASGVPPAVAPAVDRTAGVPPAPTAALSIGGRDARGPSLAAAVAPTVTAPQPASEAPPGAELAAMPQSFAEVVALFDIRREAVIAAHLKANVRLVSYEPGRIEIRPTEAAPSNLTNQLGAMLGEWTGSRWIVAVSQAEGAPTLAEAEAQRESVLRNEVAAHPLVRAVLETFPGAMIAAVRERFVAADSGTETAADEFGDDVGDDGAATEGDSS